MVNQSPILHFYFLLKINRNEWLAIHFRTVTINILMPCPVQYLSSSLKHYHHISFFVHLILLSLSLSFHFCFKVFSTLCELLTCFCKCLCKVNANMPYIALTFSCQHSLTWSTGAHDELHDKDN